MPRSTRDIIEQADESADRFEDRAPGITGVRTADFLRQGRQAFLDRADAEEEQMVAVEVARDDGQGWAAMGATRDPSGGAARLRHGAPAAERCSRPSTERLERLASLPCPRLRPRRHLVGR
jgi:hypothetical protein